MRVEHPAEPAATVAEALTHPGSVLIDAVVNRVGLAMPPKVTAGMAKGFTLYMLKVGAATKWSSSRALTC